MTNDHRSAESGGHHPAAQPAPPNPVAYLAAPVGEVHATEAAIAALTRGRPWAMLTTVVLFVVGALGTLGGAYAGLIIWINRDRGQQFIFGANLVICIVGILFGIMALAGGVLLWRFVSAARRVHSQRRPEDLERAMKALCGFWRWTAVCLLAILAAPFIAFAVAALLNVWP